MHGISSLFEQNTNFCGAGREYIHNVGRNGKVDDISTVNEK